MFEDLLFIKPNPFNRIDRRTAREIIVCSANNFSTTSIGGRIVRDFSRPLGLYTELAQYLHKNYTYFAEKDRRILNMTYGNALIHILRTGNF